MKVIIDVPDEAYKQIMEFGFLENTHGKICYKAIKNGTPIPDNATNGDVIKAMFPNSEYEILYNTVLTEIDNGLWFSLEWWNAPYQRGGTNEKQV